MSSTLTQSTVGQLVVERPGRARIFERLGIDYCCGGKKPLGQACREKGLSPEQVERELRDLDEESGPADRDWATASLSDLADHIEQTHHACLKQEMPRLEMLARKVAQAHGERHPELLELWQVFRHLKSEIESHTLREESVLFPLCRAIEAGGPRPEWFSGSVRNPIVVMTREHDDAGEALEKMRALTSGYIPPSDACNSYRALLHGLLAFERDMHQHVHKENNILFPRAIEAEARQTRA